MTYSWNSRLAMTRSMRLMACGIVQFMPRSQQANYQGFIIWSRGKVTLRNNTWEPALAIQHLRKLVTVYQKNNPEKPTAIFALVDMASPMARLSASPRPTAKPITAPTKKQGQSAGPTAAPTKKCGQLVGSTTTTKRTKTS